MLILISLSVGIQNPEFRIQNGLSIPFILILWWRRLWHGQLPWWGMIWRFCILYSFSWVTKRMEKSRPWAAAHWNY